MRLDPTVETYPVAAATNITAGQIVGLDAGGLAASVSASYSNVVGRALFGVNNSGAAGERWVAVVRGVVAMQNSATSPVSAAQVGQVVYAESPYIVSADAGLPRLGILASVSPQPWIVVGASTDPFGGRPVIRAVTVPASSGLTLQPTDNFVSINVTGTQQEFVITAPPAPTPTARAGVGCVVVAAGSTSRLVTLSGFSVLGTGTSWAVEANTKRMFIFSWDGSAWLWHGNFSEEEIPVLPQTKVAGLQASLADKEQIHQYYVDFSGGGTNCPINFVDRKGAILKLTNGVTSFALPTGAPTTTERRSEHWVRCVAVGGTRNIAPDAWSAYQYGSTIQPSVGWSIPQDGYVDFRLTRVHDGATETWFVDLLQAATRTGVALTATNYTAALNTVESHLVGINARLRRGTVWAATRQTTAITSDTTPLTIISATVPANLVQAGDAIEIAASGKIVYQSQQTLTFQFSVGGTTIWQASVYMPANDGGAWTLRLTGKVGDPGTGCTVRWGGTCTVNCALAVVGTSGFGTSPRQASVCVSGVVDTTAEWALACTLSQGGGSNTLTSEFFDLRIERSDYA